MYSPGGRKYVIYITKCCDVPIHQLITRDYSPVTRRSSKLDVKGTWKRATIPHPRRTGDGSTLNICRTRHQSVHWAPRMFSPRPREDKPSVSRSKQFQDPRQLLR